MPVSRFVGSQLYVKAPNWVQVSGYGDFTNIKIATGDAGGQFDSSEHTPEGGSLTLSQGGDPAKNWVTLISADTFCVRACTGDPKFCPTQYDEMGCFFLTSDGVGWDDVWQDCEGDDGDPPGLINGKQYEKGDPVPSMVIPPVSNCKAGASVSNGQTAAPKAPGSDSGTNPSAPGSTSWVPVPTCVPCTETAAGGAGGESSPTAKEGGEAAASGSASGSGSSSGASGTQSGDEPGGTEQVGVTKNGESASVTSPPSAPTSDAASGAGGGENGGLAARWMRRDGETTTSNGQCCFTTWTPSVVGGAGGAKETGASTNGTSGGASGAAANATGGASGSGSGRGSATLSGAKTASAATGAGTGLIGGNSTGTAKAANGTGAGGNGTKGGNGTNDSSGAFGRFDIMRLHDGMGVTKLFWTVGVMGVGMLLGGLSLL